MTIPSIAQHMLSSSSRVLHDLLLEEFIAAQPRPLGGNTGLPQGTVDLMEQNVVLAVTPLVEPIFGDALVRYATVSHRDVVLVRAGLYPEQIDPVRVDVALHSSCGGAILVPDLSLWRSANGALHLVPDTPDLFVGVAGHGLDVLLNAPWSSWDERVEGLELAAAQIVRACRRARAGA